MTPVDVLFGIQALVRLGHAGRAALEQAARDQDIVIPLPNVARPTAMDFAKSVLLDQANRNRLRHGGDLADLAEPGDPANPPAMPQLKTDAGSQIRQIEAANAIVADALRQSGLDGSSREVEMAAQRAGLYVVQQWVKGDAPPSPLARVGLALAETALDYAAAKPFLFGVGASGEKWIAAVALNLHELLPNPDDPTDWKNGFAEQATAIVFRATLTTLGDQADVLIGDKALADLAKGVIKPIVDLASQTPGQLPRWNDLRDTLLGPIAAAAAQAVIDNQAAWLGAGFAPDKALGTISKVLLEQAADPQGLRGLVTDAGLAKVYQRILGAIGSNPALIVGAGGSPDDELLRDLLSRGATVLAQAPRPFQGITGAALLDQAVAAFGTWLPKRIAGDDPWSKLAVDALKQVLDGAVSAANNGTPLLSSDRLEAFAGLLFEQAAANPGLIVGSGNSELARVAGALFGTLAKDHASLLSDDTWLEVASTALREVARNPGALVGIDDAHAHTTGFDYLSALLEFAADQIEQHGRAQGKLLFGETLAEAAKATLEAAAANAARLGEAVVMDAYKQLLGRLDSLAVAKAGAVGADGWLELFGQLVGPVLRTGQLPALSDDALLDLLHKELA